MEKEEKRTNEQIIADGSHAVDRILCRCSDERKHEFRLSELDLAILIHYYYRHYFDLFDYSFFTGCDGKEWKEIPWVSKQLDDLLELLGDKAEDLANAIVSEKEADLRRSLPVEGVKLYEGYVDGTVDRDEWLDWNYRRME